MQLPTRLTVLTIASALLACGSPAATTSGAFAKNGNPTPSDMPVATDTTYGYAMENPIRVGGGFYDGARNEHRYLRALRGPNGERLEYHRVGSCCPFRTLNNPVGEAGLLDAYKVTYAGLTTPITLYLNLYEYEAPKVPVGFTRAR